MSWIIYIYTYIIKIYIIKIYKNSLIQILQTADMFSYLNPQLYNNSNIN